MGLGPTAVIGYMNEDGNWTPVTSEKGLPVTGGGGGAVNTAIDAMQAEIDTLLSTVADLEARLEALENPEEG